MQRDVCAVAVSVRAGSPRVTIRAEAVPPRPNWRERIQDVNLLPEVVERAVRIAAGIAALIGLLSKLSRRAAGPRAACLSPS